MSNKGISVVIPNYNGIHLLPQILPPLFKALVFTALPYEVIISDDCSTDNSVNFLKKEFPQIKLIENKTNRGFSPTVNKGIYVAQYDFVLFLNSDVILEENYFIPLFRYFEKEDTFGVMGRVIGWDNDTIQDAAKYPSFHGVKLKTSGNYLPDEICTNDWLYSMFLSGANAFVDRKKLIALKGLDEIFAPFYVEDFELCLRAWRLGWKCYYEHFAICRHQVSVTIKNKSRKNYIDAVYDRNKMFLHAMHLPKTKRALWYLQLIPEAFIRLVTGRFYYFTSLKLFFQKRHLIKQSRQRLIDLQKETNTLLSLDEVVKIIIDSVKGKKIRKFL